MHSIAYALLAASLYNCAAPLAAPVLFPATMEVSFIDPRDVDCLAPDVKLELARGLLRAEDAAARCAIDRRRERAVYRVELDDKNSKLAEMEGLRVWSNLAKGSLVVAAIAAAVTVVIVVTQSLK